MITDAIVLFDALEQWFLEFVAFLFQLLAFILDAVDSGRLHGYGSPPYGLAVVSALFGFFVMLFTLYIAIALVFQRTPLAEMCGGSADLCGINTENKTASDQPKEGDDSAQAPPSAAVPSAQAQASTGKQSV